MQGGEEEEAQTLPSPYSPLPPSRWSLSTNGGAVQGDEEEATESWSGVGMSEGAFERLKEREGDIEHVAVSPSPSLPAPLPFLSPSLFQSLSVSLCRYSMRGEGGRHLPLSFCLCPAVALPRGRVLRGHRYSCRGYMCPVQLKSFPSLNDERGRFRALEGEGGRH